MIEEDENQEFDSEEIDGMLQEMIDSLKEIEKSMQNDDSSESREAKQATNEADGEAALHNEDHERGFNVVDDETTSEVDGSEQVDGADEALMEESLEETNTSDLYSGV